MDYKKPEMTEFAMPVADAQHGGQIQGTCQTGSRANACTAGSAPVDQGNICNTGSLAQSSCLTGGAPNQQATNCLNGASALDGVINPV